MKEYKSEVEKIVREEVIPIFKSHGYNIHEDYGRLALKNDKKQILINILEEEKDYISLYACPVKSFDRWANSRHIKYDLCYKYAWKDEAVRKHGVEKTIKKFEYLCEVVPKDYFNEFIRIVL